MADRIVAAVRLKRKLMEGVSMQGDILATIQKYTRKLLFAHPGRETDRLKRELVKLVTKQYFKDAVKSGRKSAVPILDRIGGIELVESVGKLSGVPLRVLSTFNTRNTKWFAQEVTTNTAALSSELKAELARAARDGVAKRDMVDRVTKAYQAELKQIKKARKHLSAANKAVANAEATGDIKAIRAAKKARSQAASATRKVKTAMGRLENNVQGVARDAVRRDMQEAQLASYRQAGFRVFSWVTVNGSLGCPDCIALHGTTHTYQEWQGQGPGDGQTVCLDSCMCELVPEQFTENNKSIEGPVNPYLFDELNTTPAQSQARQ